MSRFGLIFSFVIAFVILLGPVGWAQESDAPTINGAPLLNGAPVINGESDQVEPIPPAEVSEITDAGPALPNIENRGAVEAFVDGVVRAYMEKDKLAGVTLSIVRNGEILYARGYGIADVGGEAAVDPAATLFRVGSISKTFLWTALMQLQEQGKLDLNDPANDYLPAANQLEDAGFDEPIRIWNLMTHTPGFEDIAVGHLFSRTASDVRPMTEYLRNFRPAQVREAGTSTSYSNYGAGIAGLIVTTVSGEPDFETYVEKYITGPLAMNHSTFREPLGERAGLPGPMDAELAANVSKGFARKRGGWETTDFEFITQLGPAGAFSSTATDMARYMMAHLNFGELDGQRILRPASVATLRETLFSNAEDVNGFAHGFMEYSTPGGFVAYGHGGATFYFMSNMVLVPALKLGIFVSSNTGTGRSLAAALPNLFIERFFAPDASITPEPPGDFVTTGQRYVGTYRSDRHAYTLVEKLAALAGGDTSVSISPDGFLVTSSSNSSTRWVQVAPNSFQEVNGFRRIAFGEDGDGNITKFFSDDGTAAATKIGFFRTAQWFGIIMVLGAISGFGCTMGAWLRRRRPLHESLNESISSRLSAAQGFMWLSFLIAFGVAISTFASLGIDLVYDFPPTSLVVALWLAIVATVLNILALPGLYIIWRDRNWPFWRRMRHSAAILIGFALFMTLLDWNMIGFNYF
jgi:CubicO group peptidase (beta-lactamase class C family)